MCDGFSEAFMLAAIEGATAAEAAATASGLASAATTAATVGGYLGAGASAIATISPVLMIGGSMLSTGMKQYGQSQQQAQQRADAEQDQRYNQISNDKQEMEQAQQRMMYSQAAEARLLTAAGESGVSGPSVDRQYNAIAGASEQDIASLEANRDSANQQASMQTESIYNQNPGVNPFAAGLQIAGSGLSTYAAVKRM